MSTFARIVNRSATNILTSALRGEHPVRISGPRESNLFGDGISVNLGTNKITSSNPKTRDIVAMSPRATILVKKSAFSSMKHVNDLQWMDRTEKMLLRATKALFAYKVAQIRAYESLNKVVDFFEEYNELNLNLFAELLHNAKFLQVPEDIVTPTNIEALDLIISSVRNSLADSAYDEIKEDILKLAQRHAFSNDNQFTTWIVDPSSVDNYGTGPGTGVIEITSYSSFNCATDLNTDPSAASFTIEDPYRLSNIIEEDIELAINEALTGTIGLLDELAGGDLDPSIFDAKSIVASGIELLGLGNFDSTLDVHYIREQMRKLYLGKPFIESPDSVYFFIRGNKTVQDYSDDESPFQREDLAIDETILEAERILFTNKRVDLETYKKLRQFSDNSLAMKCVYVGYITTTSTSWSGGKWTLTANCTDNMGWLEWSRFMIEPALQDPQGILEDPLTPYVIKTDAQGRVLTANGPELIDENKELLRSGLLSYDSGILNGQIATENNLLQGQYNQGGSLSGAKILQHPNGFVYRWKTGIITATAAVNTVDPLNENEVTLKTLSQQYGLTVAKDVLNNLDIANILSLLIVGQPYNVETFIEQAYQAHNISKQSATAALAPTDPLASVIDVIRRQNIHTGNFRPYRMITMSNSTLEQTASSNVIRSEINDNISQLRIRRSQLQQKIRDIRRNTSVDNILIRTLRAEVAAIDASIQKQVDVARKSTNVSSADILTANFNLFGRNRVLPLTGNFTADHEVTRAMMMVGAERRIEDVRLNRDQNLFIVSDQYDEHTDIRPYLFELRNSSYEIFRGDFITVLDQCKIASGFINLEFFCNPQGHLEFRPPQWNRTPLSVLERLFQITEETNKKVVPDFLRNIFETRSASLRREIHSLNVRIVMLALLLGKYPDGSLIPNLPNPADSIFLPEGTNRGKSSLRFFGVRLDRIKSDGEKSLELRQGQINLGGLGSLVDTGDQLFGEGIKLDAVFGEEGDVLNGDTNTLLGIFDPIFQEEQGVINNVLTNANKTESFDAKGIATSANLNAIREEFRKIAGIDPASDLVGDSGIFSDGDFVFSTQSTAANDEARQISKVNKYLDKLQETISNRDNLVTILARNEEKEKELDEIETILSGEFTGALEGVLDEQGGNGLLDQISTGLDSVERVLDTAKNVVKTVTDIFSGDATKGSLFDHLVEDDTRNLSGPGSGRRYIINDRDIISCTFTERPPDFCRVDVVGNAPIIGNQLRDSFQERYFWAGGTDFDLWRKYGYKHSGNIDLPFASSAELQSRPYAQLELQLQRVRINEAQVVVVGNEYYTPGDVVYIPEKGLLYYVRSVSHNFQLNGEFTTQLHLEFGHPPGQYLPSPLDVIGQQLLKDPLVGNTLVYRNQQGDDNYRVLQPDSALVFPASPDISMDNIQILLDHRDNMVRYMNMIIDLNSILIGERKVLIRGFVRSESDADLSTVRNNMRVVRELLQNPIQLTQSDPNTLGDDFLDFTSSAARSIGIGTENTKGTTGMVLPNGLTAQAISAENIIEQLVVLNKEGTVSQIQCLDTELLSAQVLDNKEIGGDTYESVFPKGGPKQRTWLDFRDDLTQLKNIIEVGVLDVVRAVDTAGQAEIDIL